MTLSKPKPSNSRSQQPDHKPTTPSMILQSPNITSKDSTQTRSLVGSLHTKKLQALKAITPSWVSMTLVTNSITVADKTDIPISALKTVSTPLINPKNQLLCLTV